jgi:hypothetical protein
MYIPPILCIAAALFFHQVLKIAMKGTGEQSRASGKMKMNYTVHNPHNILTALTTLNTNQISNSIIIM